MENKAAYHCLSGCRNGQSRTMCSSFATTWPPATVTPTAGDSGMHFARTSAAVQWCLVNAHLYEHQILTQVIAVTQACCLPVPA